MNYLIIIILLSSYTFAQNASVRNELELNTNPRDNSIGISFGTWFPSDYDYSNRLNFGVCYEHKLINYLNFIVSYNQYYFTIENKDSQKDIRSAIFSIGMRAGIKDIALHINFANFNGYYTGNGIDTGINFNLIRKYLTEVDIMLKIIYNREINLVPGISLTINQLL